jgi:hypothetical protein
MNESTPLDTLAGMEVDIRPKLYSANMIYLSTFLGGPLAAGILLRKNFVNLGQHKKGFYAIFIGILVSILFIIGMLTTPEAVIDKIPRYLIPAFYTAIVAFIVEFTMGKILRTHKETNGPLYSGWNATGIAVGTAVLIVGTGIGLEFLKAESSAFDEELYEKHLNEFTNNETEALKLFEMPTEKPIAMLEFISDTGIPAWKTNVEILKTIEKMPDLPADLKERNDLLARYCVLRIESFQLIYSILGEDGVDSGPALEQKNQEIEDILKKLQ